jgi:hypothetical protein
VEVTFHETRRHEAPAGVDAFACGRDARLDGSDASLAHGDIDCRTRAVRQACVA